ncbi:hypothetical protein N7463_001022 [Penicillium fimorum]|uniref:Uncharacterized protein n=1 Tax=Penicillium fimorum TaxID=1882269 RepID=A0A9W9Y5B3_9EURO|nr:hypothetical protein N7463_001022 [Penicillium fimorum]
MSTPTLINLPPPPSEPVTPSDMGPGTPNSGTTSLSALSTTAIKDGHQGHSFPHSHHAHQSSTSSTTLEAERADRISRLAGLERVATARAGGQTSSGQVIPPYAPGYFESQVLKERSTVGSASATGSIAGRTTWASSSDTYDADKMSEYHEEDGTSSVGNISDEGNASLVGFGEGANSTYSGPISRPPGMNRVSSGRPTSIGSQNVNRPNSLASYLQQQQHHAEESSMMSSSPAGSMTPEPVNEDARMVDGMTFDSDIVDTTARTPRLVATPGHNNGGFGSPGRD